MKRDDVVSSEIPQWTVGTEVESIMEDWFNEYKDQEQKIYLLV